MIMIDQSSQVQVIITLLNGRTSIGFLKKHEKVHGDMLDLYPQVLSSYTIKLA